MQPAADFTRFISAFEEKLALVIPAAVSMEPYCCRYLEHLLKHKRYYLHIYADVLQKLTGRTGKSISETTLIDYGCGNGLLGLFASYCGFKKVIFADVDEKFLEASGQLAKQIGLKRGIFLAGDMNDMFTRVQNEKPDAIAGTDVIEHMYDLRQFMQILKKVNPLIVSVFTTASNPMNPLKRIELRKIQLRDELDGGNPGDYALFGAAPLEPFLKIRERIIRENTGNMPDPEITKLSIATRGLNRADIEKAVSDYLVTGQMPEPAAGTNTCNPINGSWSERLLPLEAYHHLYRDAGFTCKIYAGFYNVFEGGASVFVKKLLNVFSALFGKRFSPYIVIVGCKG